MRYVGGPLLVLVLAAGSASGCASDVGSALSAEAGTGPVDADVVGEPTGGTDAGDARVPGLMDAAPEPVADAGDARVADAAQESDADFSDLLTIEEGTLPLVLSAPHGGETPVPGVAERTSSGAVNVIDYATYELALQIQERLFASTGKRAHLVAARASRKYIDFNRDEPEAYESSAAAPVYHAYHDALDRAVSAVKTQAPAAALLLDVHGQSVDVAVALRGTRNGQTADLATLYAKPKGFLTTLLASGVAVSPASSNVLTIENPSFNGGFIVGSQGLSGSGGLNAVQLEFGLDYRDPAAAVTSTASKVADALVAHLQSQGAL